MIGKTLSHFKITAKLGEGGMGEVYRAEDSKLDREVAIKVLPADFTQDPERLARFEREAKVLASLNHQNIAAIHQVEQVESTYFLVMELVEGETLAERVARGAIPVDEALPIALQIAEGLEAAHEGGVLTRPRDDVRHKLDYPNPRLLGADAFRLFPLHQTGPLLDLSDQLLRAALSSDADEPASFRGPMGIRASQRQIIHDLRGDGDRRGRRRAIHLHHVRSGVAIKKREQSDAGFE